MPHRFTSVALLLLSASVQAQSSGTVHVFGPPGSETERRCLVVVERPEGGCASWDELTLTSDEGVQVELGERHGACVREAHVRSATPRDAITLVATGPDLSATGLVALANDGELVIEAVRTRRRLRVTVEGDDTAAHAYWQGGDAALDRDRTGRFVGRVPPEGLVAVLARRGGVTGATVVGRATESTVMILPSDLSVPIGGAPRTAAFVIVTDRRGRPSENVPLQILSDRGALEWLRWREPGVAAVGLSVEEAVPSIDLRASTGTAADSHDLAVSGGYPVRANLRGPESVELGDPWSLTTEAVDLVGDPVPDSDLRIVWNEGASQSEGGRAQCHARTSGTMAVHLQARIDGRWVPMATHHVRVVEPVVEAPSPPPPPPLPPAPRLRLGAHVGVGVDTWARWSPRIGVEASVAIGSRLWLGAAGSYAITPFDATGSDGVGPQRAEVRQHAVDLEAFADVVLLPWLHARGAVGASVARLAADVDSSSASEVDARFIGTLGVAPVYSGDRLWVGGLVGARVALAQRAAFEESPVRFVVEVRGGWQLR